MRLRHFSHRLVIVLTCGALTLSGCATQSQRIGADDGSDVCRPQRVSLDSTGNYFAEDILKGAAIGAVGGGLIGGLAGGNVRGALIGAAAGAAVGAAGGYWKARQQQIGDQQALYQTVSADIQRDNASIDKTQIAFDQLVECRRAEAGRIRRDLRAGVIARPQAEAAMAAVVQRSANDLRLAQDISGKIQERSSNFAFANTQVNPGAASSASSPSRAASVTRTAAAPARARGRNGQPATPAEEVQVATSTNLAKRDHLAQSISTAQANKSSFELI